MPPSGRLPPPPPPSAVLPPSLPPSLVPASVGLGSVTPPSGSRVPPHTPFVEPGACTHGMPGQQSALLVQVSPFGMQDPAAPHLLFTQGAPQQSALVAQTVSFVGGVPPSVPVQSTGLMRQRGIPSASLLQQLAGFLLQ